MLKKSSGRTVSRRKANPQTRTQIILPSSRIPPQRTSALTIFSRFFSIIALVFCLISLGITWTANSRTQAILASIRAPTHYKVTFRPNTIPVIGVQLTGRVPIK